MDRCAFQFCYYHDPKNVKKDNINVRKYKCDYCDEAYYHSDFCKKFDKEHQKKCKGRLGITQGSYETQDLMMMMRTQPLNQNTNDTLLQTPGFMQTGGLQHDSKPIDFGGLMPFGEHHAMNNLMNNPLNNTITSQKKMFFNNYIIYQDRMLGEGSYGRVVYAQEALTKEEVAIKMVNKEFLETNSQGILLKREICIQRDLQHQHILGLKDVFDDDKMVFLVLEFASGGTLFDYIQKREGLKEREAFIYFLQTCLAVDFLHKKDIIHRDIKPENLLMDKAKKLKLCDFGCSFQFLKNSPKIRKTYCGTVDYMAPEFFKRIPHGKPADIWALGVLVYEMVHAQPPFDTNSEGEKISLIQDCENQIIAYRPGISQEFKDLISFILRSDPKDRPTFDEIFDHPWVRKFEEKLNIDVERLRYKDSILGDYAKQAKVEDYFSNCELRPSEVMKFADEDYRISYQTENKEKKKQETEAKEAEKKGNADISFVGKAAGQKDDGGVVANKSNLVQMNLLEINHQHHHTCSHTDCAIKVAKNYTTCSIGSKKCKKDVSTKNIERSSSIKLKTAVMIKNDNTNLPSGYDNLTSTKKNLNEELDKKITKSTASNKKSQKGSHYQNQQDYLQRKNKREGHENDIYHISTSQKKHSTQREKSEEKSINFLLRRADSIGESFLSNEKKSLVKKREVYPERPLKKDKAFQINKDSDNKENIDINIGSRRIDQNRSPLKPKVGNKAERLLLQKIERKNPRKKRPYKRCRSVIQLSDNELEELDTREKRRSKPN